MASIQTDEIDSIKSTFGNQVKVVSAIGEFTNVVTFQPENLNLQCKFQLSSSYPESPPTIIVRSQQMGAEQINNMELALQTLADSKLGSSMLNDLSNYCLELITEQDTDLSIPCVKAKTKTASQKFKQKKKKTPKSENEQPAQGKKPPMKTAAEVIKRLQWDDGVDKEEFVVGYIDRLTGLEEKAFTDFTWEDLASVDQYCLAIPQHRIQYFKYRDEKVWDKNERLDNVFGSTGSKLTLPDTIQRYHAARIEKDDEDDLDGRDSDIQGDTEAEGYTKSTHESEQKRDLLADFSTMSFSLNQTAKPLESPGNVCEGIEKHGADNTEEESRRTATTKRRLNYFIALQITNKELISKLEHIQSEILKKNPDFEEYQICSSMFHLTLNLLRLNSEAEVITCVSVMKNMKRNLFQLMKRACKISVEGVDHFSERVIYAKLKVNQGLLELVDTLKYNLAMADVDVEIGATFTPHITLFKMDWGSYHVWRRHGMKVLLPTFEKGIGYQMIDNISVCKMGAVSEIDYFYQKVFEFRLSDFDFEL